MKTSKITLAADESFPAPVNPGFNPDGGWETIAQAVTACLEQPDPDAAFRACVDFQLRACEPGAAKDMVQAWEDAGRF